MANSELFKDAEKLFPYLGMVHEDFSSEIFQQLIVVDGHSA